MDMETIKYHINYSEHYPDSSKWGAEVDSESPSLSYPMDEGRMVFETEREAQDWIEKQSHPHHYFIEEVAHMEPDGADWRYCL